MKTTTRFVFDQLKPTLDDIGRLVAQSPLSLDHRAGLALAVLTYFAGLTRAAFREAEKPVSPTEVAALIELALEPGDEDQEP